MKDLIRRLLPICTALVLAIALAACAGETEGDSDTSGEASMSAESEGGEHADGVEGSESGEEGEGEHGGEGEGRESGDEGEGGRESEGEHDGEGEGREGREGGGEEEGEHGGEAGHDEGGEEGEESGTYIAAGETWDVVRRGARLVLAFNAESGVFEGTVQNTTDGTLCAVRVEVHLADGPELGPTSRQDVAAGATANVTLSADGESFESWTAHPEMSACGG